MRAAAADAAMAAAKKAGEAADAVAAGAAAAAKRAAAAAERAAERAAAEEVHPTCATVKRARLAERATEKQPRGGDGGNAHARKQPRLAELPVEGAGDKGEEEMEPGWRLQCLGCGETGNYDGESGAEYTDPRATKSIEPRELVVCESCGTWQHTPCMEKLWLLGGAPTQEGRDYLCASCAPETDCGFISSISH